MPPTAIVTPHRIHLEGVPRIHFFEPGEERSPEEVPLAAAVRAIADYLGESEPPKIVREHDRTWRLDRTYVAVHAACGAAFRCSWGPGWDLDIAELAFITDDPGEPHRRAFAAVGRAVDLVHDDCPDRDAQFRDCVRRSLEAGIPVIGFGVVGPPEASLITGLDEDGEVAIGWSCFQSMAPWNDGLALEPSGEFRRRGWVAATEALAIAGDRLPPTGPREQTADTIAFALRLARTPFIATRGRANGHAAFDAWAAALADEAAWASLDPAADAAELRARYEGHDQGVGIVAEARWYAARWCELAAERLPELAGPLGEAMRRYDAIHDRMWEAWAVTGRPPWTDENARRLLDPRARSALVAILRAAREDDVAAIGALERAAALL